MITVGGGAPRRTCDPARRGKGFALAFGLPHALAGRPDAVLVLDADCALTRGSLAALDAALSAGAAVVQGSVSVRNPDAGVGCFVRLPTRLTSSTFADLPSGEVSARATATGRRTAWDSSKRATGTL